jgi:ribosome biogenesis GTPase
MKILELGFYDWDLNNYNRELENGFARARITRVDKDHYLVRDEQNEVPGQVTGKIKFSTEEAQELPCVGDWVLVQYYDNHQLAIIHLVLPRRSYLRRKSSGKTSEYQIIASNIDFAFIIQSFDSNFNIRRLERFIAMAVEGNVEPIILLSKSDLLTQKDIDYKIEEIEKSHIQYKIITFNNQSDTGYQSVKNILHAGMTYCLLGSSGVGKTSLLNNLIGNKTFEIQSVREKDNRGRHTTTRRQLTIIENGAILIDTPGMRELGLMEIGSIDESFQDITKLAQKCRFEDCSHTVEPDCAVLKAVTNGDLIKDRFNAYIKLKKEAEFHNLSYSERRTKDKNFGRLIKNTLEHLKKQKL